MAAATSVGGNRQDGADYKPCVLKATTSQQSISMNPDLEYLLQHTGKDASNNASTVEIYLAFDGTVDADASEGADKAILMNQQPMPIGPGLDILKYRSSAEACFNVIPGPFHREL